MNTRNHKSIKNGYYYLYKGYRLCNHGYYPPDRCIWWEAVNIETGCGDFHAHTKKDLKSLIDEYENTLPITTTT